MPAGSSPYICMDELFTIKPVTCIKKINQFKSILISCQLQINQPIQVFCTLLLNKASKHLFQCNCCLIGEAEKMSF